MSRTLSLPQIATYVVSASILSVAAWVALYGPTQPIPMHFDVSGQADRYGSRFELAGVLVLLATLNVIVSVVTGHQANKTEGTGRRPLRQGQYVSVLIMAATSAFITYASLGPSGALGVTALGGAMAFISLISLIIGAIMGRMPPNAFIGVRTPWAFKSRLAWDKSNRLAGRLMFWSGLIGLVATPFAPQPFGTIAITVALVLSALFSSFESWRVWRSDPEASSF